MSLFVGRIHFDQQQREYDGTPRGIFLARSVRGSQPMAAKPDAVLPIVKIQLCVLQPFVLVPMRLFRSPDPCLPSFKRAA
ncbi:hypothetical protein RE6C_05878 [Rhodopirellula europaea 6C]|uniref:Uncharacterized protein n=1 Tax=Rhodopirellula europaea 6C TaxID=1263867 RepID=M2AAA8_9BACT|nr:hypothetical protein RE6C_05878 [Rhodopirellula europaea 6C]